MEIAIIGGGVAGLFTAWNLAKMKIDARIVLYDSGKVGGGATLKAAGMLAPVNELEFQEIGLLKAGLASLNLYRYEIGPQLGDIGLRGQGTLEVGITQDDAAYLRRQFEFQREQGLEVEWLSGNQIREVEPAVSQHIQQAIWSQTDTQVDPKLVVMRLEAQLRTMGVTIQDFTPVQAWRATDDGRVTLETRQGAVSFDKVLIAPGVPSAQTAAMLPYKIYPVRGEMVCLNLPAVTLLDTQVRIYNKILGTAYVVPKADRILCGSTNEEQGTAAVNTAGGVLDILRKCYAAVPGIYELEMQETWAGLRPSTLNRLPLLDREAGTQIYHLNGLYRHGILLGPLMGKATAKLMLDDYRMVEVTEFTMPGAHLTSDGNPAI